MSYDEATAFRALLSSTPDLIYFLDRDGRYCYVGDGAAALHGRGRDSMLGRAAAEAGFAPEVAERFESQRREVMASGRPVRDEATHVTGTSESVYEYVIAPVVRDEETLGVVVVSRDVTERRRAEAALRESEAKFSIAFDRSPLALTITSVETGRLVEVNEGFVRLSGYTREEAVGRTPEELGLWVKSEIRAERFARLRAGLPVPDIETRFRIKNGDELIGVIGSALVEINSRPCVLSSVIDITQRKRAEEAKDDFLATLSHELRTPLTAGFGWVKLLARASEPDLLESGLKAIQDSIVSQIRLIDDLLDVSRIAAGKLYVDMQAVDLGALVEAVMEAIRPSAAAKQIEIQTGVDAVLTVYGDAARLKQVVWNLLSNAVKFTPAGGRISVELHRRERSAEIVVRDTGEGIDPAFLPHVFERFRQADSSASRSHGGLGLGLSIVASLVEAHGGAVRAESEGAGHGSTFIVSLPLLAQEAMQPIRPAVRARNCADLTGLRVLLVDDDVATRTLVSTSLGAAGAEVRSYSNAGQAYDGVLDWKPDVLISDLAMPHEDGYSLIRRIRASGSAIPAVAITAYTRAEDEHRVRDAGFHRHIPKPFDPDDLVRAVRDLAPV